MMASSPQRRDAERQDACQKARQISHVCEQLQIRLDPIDWYQFGLQAPVSTNNVVIASLMDLSQRQPDTLLLSIQIRLLEHAALAAISARPGLKATLWTPVDVIQPQPFLSLWVITLETDERITLIEMLRDRQRIYETLQIERYDQKQLTMLFGPMSEGEYQLGEQVSIRERDLHYVGEIIYIIPPGKPLTKHLPTSRGRHLVSGKPYMNDTSARYLVDCHDGFPHLVKQSQIIR